MATPPPKHDPEEMDLGTQSDFQLLSDFTDLVSKERSRQLKAIAWEIMRRYTASLTAHEPKGKKDRRSILGETRWGDARRVEAVFGIRRGVLRRLLIEGKIQSKHLEVDRPNSDDAAAVRAKRLYNLWSIADYMEGKD